MDSHFRGNDKPLFCFNKLLINLYEVHFQNTQSCHSEGVIVRRGEEESQRLFEELRVTNVLFSVNF